MRVLITNAFLVNPTGSELYVRDLALELQRRGHKPIVYSPRLGELARVLRLATVPVVSDLRSVGATPDLIHGQHHLPTMTALANFPDVPVVYFCHGSVPWLEIPPRHPRIRAYVAVGESVRDRLLFEHGIAEGRIHTIPNAVDLTRFRPRPPLPQPPRRALVFSNQISEKNHLGVIRQACARHKLELDVVGMANGNPTMEPETLLPNYDIVFARGRAALESLAVGAAVICCDIEGAGPLVTTGNLTDLRAENFGRRILRHPLTAEHLAAEIARYDPDDAAAVSSRIRSEAGLPSIVERILAVYGAASADWTEAARDPAAEAAAMSAYLSWLGESERTLPVAARRPQPSEEAPAAQEAARKQIEDLRSALARAEAEREMLRGQVARLEAMVAGITRTVTWRAYQRLVGFAPFLNLYLFLSRPFKRGSGRGHPGGDGHPPSDGDDPPPDDSGDPAGPPGGAPAGSLVDGRPKPAGEVPSPANPAKRTASVRSAQTWGEPRILALLQFHNEMRYLPGFFHNVAPHVDGVIALDDGSTDGSGEVVAWQPALNHLIRIPPRTPHVWDEPRNRRLLVEAAWRCRAGWLVVVDADERLEVDFGSRARAEIARAEREGQLAYRVRVRELWDRPDRYRADGIWGEKLPVRLFRARPDHEFDERPLHGHWAPLNSRRPSGGYPIADLVVYHLRMISSQDRLARQARHRRLDPQARHQAIGYDYLTDETGLRLEALPEGRGYQPPHERHPLEPDEI